MQQIQNQNNCKYLVKISNYETVCMSEVEHQTYIQNRLAENYSLTIVFLIMIVGFYLGFMFVGAYLIK